MAEVATVTLTQEASLGLPITEEHLRLVGNLPIQVKLGRNEPRHRKPIASMSQIMSRLKDVPVPASVDWYTKAAASIARMYLNDRYGDCVFAGKGHCLGIWSANDTDSGGMVLATDQEISDQYFNYTGGRDSGAVISEVLDYMKSPGFLAGGKRYQIADYVSCDWTSKELTQVGLALFGTGSIGIDLPNDWTSAAVWDVTNSRIVGGHDVSPCGYGANVLSTNADGVVISSWGRLYLITWKAWTSRNWLTELYFMLPTTLWTGADKMAPSGVDYAGLLADLALMQHGNVPPLPGPTPPPVPPSPPAPPEHEYTEFPAMDIPVTIGGFRIATAHIPTVHMDVQTHANLAGAAGFGLSDLWKIAQHALAIWSAIKNDQALKDAINALLADFGIPPILMQRTASAQANGVSVNYWTIAADVFAIVQAVRTSGALSAQTAAAVAKLLADLGLSIG